MIKNYASVRSSSLIYSSRLSPISQTAIDGKEVPSSGGTFSIPILIELSRYSINVSNIKCHDIKNEIIRLTNQNNRSVQ